MIDSAFGAALYANRRYTENPTVDHYVNVNSIYMERKRREMPRKCLRRVKALLELRAARPPRRRG